MCKCPHHLLATILLACTCLCPGFFFSWDEKVPLAPCLTSPPPPPPSRCDPTGVQRTRACPIYTLPTFLFCLPRLPYLHALIVPPPFLFPPSPPSFFLSHRNGSHTCRWVFNNLRENPHYQVQKHFFQEMELTSILVHVISCISPTPNYTLIEAQSHNRSR